jgi:hypothetical protein
VTKVVTETRPATVSTPSPKPASTAPSAAATAAAGAFASAAIAANANQAALPVGAAVFAPAQIAAAVAAAVAGTTSTPTPAATTPSAPHTRVVAGHATGEYAVAYTNGTFRRPSQIILTVDASPAQPGSVDWNVVCFEDGGGVGREEGHSTIPLPTTKTLSLPAPSNYCIGSANVQLSKSGSVTISLTG